VRPDYGTAMAELITPTTRLHRAWLAARDDWGRGTYQDGSGLRPGDDVDSPAGFAAWVDRLIGESDPARPPAPGWVHCSYRWIVENDAVLGAIALRHDLTDALREVGGHIGYGVRPSARRRGLATFALGEMLGHARRLGLERVLITCAEDNEASRRTIEHHGGVLADVRDTAHGRSRRYWIPLGP
jgi:predicted acetyltransferase